MGLLMTSLFIPAPFGPYWRPNLAQLFQYISDAPHIQHGQRYPCLFPVVISPWHRRFLFICSVPHFFLKKTLKTKISVFLKDQGMMRRILLYRLGMSRKIQVGLGRDRTSQNQIESARVLVTLLKTGNR